MATALSNLSKQDTKGLNGKGHRIAIVVSEWNKRITKSLLDGAVSTLEELKVKSKHISIYWVPGTFELSFACASLAKNNLYDATIAIGSVIRGETSHFDFVCQAAAQGIAAVNVEHDTPTIFCVLTDDNMEQAEARSGGKHGNKGVEAAVAALKMIRFTDPK